MDTYASRTGLKPEKVGKMMADTTWMSATEAVEYGFADEIITGGQAPASDMAIVNAIQNYANVPAALRIVPPPSKPINLMTPQAIRLREEVKILTRKGE